MKSSLDPISIIEDSGLAEAEVSHLNQRLQRLIQVIQQLAVARDLDTIMATVRTGARHLIGADGATFVLRDGDQCYYADEDAIAPLWKGGRFPLSACISGWVMLNQQSVVIEDIYADDRIPADAYRPTFVKSLAMVPIRTRDPVGAIGNYWATRHTPTPEELDLLQTLADTAAIALDNLHLYEEQERRIQERTAQLQRALDCEALLKRITDNVRDSLDERQILATAAQELGHGLALSRCKTTLYHLEQATATVYYEYQPSQATVTCGHTVSMTESPEFYHQLLLGETVQFCQVSSPTLLSAAKPEVLTLACPIMDDHQVLGDIRLYRDSAIPFADLDVRLVQQVATQCAIALRQARLHEAAQAQVKELERLNQLKDDFLSTVSHELRSPMASIRMAVKMLETMLGMITRTPAPVPYADIILKSGNVAKVTQYLNILSKECQREINLINDLLDLTRLEADITPIVQPVVLQEWVPQIAESFVERTRQQQQTLQLHIPDTLPPLRTNLAALERILTELLQNACKYTPAGETITVSATHHPTPAEPLADPDHPLFRLTVSNSGVEISESDRTAIFDKFYRIPNGDPWKNGGTGLGLALVKRLVEQMSGSIHVSSGDRVVSFEMSLPSLSSSSI